MRTTTLAKKLAKFTLLKKANDVVVLDLRKISDIADFFVICSGDSDTQVKAIADAVIEGGNDEGIHVWHSEGLTERQWLILDYVDVVVHIFQKDTRKYYNLERLWSDAKAEHIKDEVKPKKNTKTTKKKIERISKK